MMTDRHAWAVNQLLSKALPDEDDEGREYIASLSAASESPIGIALAADLPPTMLVDQGETGEVLVNGRITDNLVACLLKIDPQDDEALLWFAPTELHALSDA
jgi:hypothetical protein